VDYGVEPTELIDLARYGRRPGDGREVPADRFPGAGCRREGVATSTLVSSVQNDLMALLDQEPCRHEAEAVR